MQSFLKYFIPIDLNLMFPVKVKKLNGSHFKNLRYCINEILAGKKLSFFLTLRKYKLSKPKYGDRLSTNCSSMFF